VTKVTKYPASGGRFLHLHCGTSCLGDDLGQFEAAEQVHEGDHGVHNEREREEQCRDIHVRALAELHMPPGVEGDSIQREHRQTEQEVLPRPAFSQRMNERQGAEADKHAGDHPVQDGI